MNNSFMNNRVNFVVTVLGENSSARVKQATSGFEYVLTQDELGPEIVEVLEPGLVLSGVDMGGGENPKYLQIEKLSPARLERIRLSKLDANLFQSAVVASENLAVATRQFLERKHRLDSLVREAAELQKQIIVASEETKDAELLLRNSLDQRDEAVKQLA
jgi:hypothetical protein